MTFSHLLLDYLVRGGQQRFRDGKAECFGGLEVENHFVLGRGLHWEVGRFLTFENAIDIAGGAPTVVNNVRPVGNQTAGADELAPVENRGQFVPGRKRDN